MLARFPFRCTKALRRRRVKVGMEVEEGAVMERVAASCARSR